MNNFSKGSLGNYPLVRMRRNRMKKFSRDIISENFINIKNLIYPLFVTDYEKEDSFISSMPGVKRHSLKSLVKEDLSSLYIVSPCIEKGPLHIQY